MSNSESILYFTDALGVTDGYKGAFMQIVKACGIPPHKIQFHNVYVAISDALRKRGNEKEKVINPERYHEIKALVDSKVHATKPKVIVVSCAATLAVINGNTVGADKISKTRGSYYDYNGIPCIIVPPVSSIYRNQKQKEISDDEDGDTYRIKDGHWLLARDWSKVGRFYNGATRRFPDFQYSVARSRLDLQMAEHWLSQCKLISCDIETTGSHEAGGHTISCVGYTGLHSSGAIRSYVIPFADKFVASGLAWRHEDDLIQAFETVRRINATPIPKVMQNGSYDSAYFITWNLPIENYILDTMHMWHSIYPELDKSLDVISSVLLDQYTYWKQDIKGIQEDKSGLGRRDHSMERFWRYNALDCHNTLCSALLLIRLVSGNEKVRTNYGREFLQMLAGLYMTMRGLKCDESVRAELRAELEQEALAANQRFCKMIDDPDFNVNSPAQKVALLYDLLGATPRNANGKIIRGKTQRGRSAGKNALKHIKTEHPFFRIIIDAMEAEMEPKKQISNVCDMRVNTSRVRSSISVRTETWRFSSSGSPFWDGSNLQNIRKSMRRFMVADDGHILFDVDYSQSDAVFVAFESNDKNYIETMTSGKDTHAVHAEFFFKKPYDEIVEGKKNDDELITHPILGIRNITKRIVHGANFQMAGSTLYTQMGKEAVLKTAQLLGFPQLMTATEDTLHMFCQRLLNSYRQLYPRLAKNGWYGEIAQMLIRDRMITNAFGMTRSFISNPRDSGTQREATAFYGQSGTAGNMNRVLDETIFGYIPPAFRDGPNECAKAQPLKLDHTDFGLEFGLQVHDSLIGQINTRAPRWKEGLHNLLIVMERPVTINGHRVVVPAEAEIGKQWGKGMIPWQSGDPYDLDRVCAGR